MHPTGLDELILAAEIEESSSRATASDTSLKQPPSLSSANSSAYSSYPPLSASSKSSLYQSLHHHNYHMLTQYHHQQQQLQQQQQQQQPQPTFLIPYAPPYVPTGRGLGYTPQLLASISNNRDNFMQVPTPRNKSELELYSLLEKANLLQYFETFLKYGGDDVQQLSDADEEEFIEIMKLIGMTNKPLHIRRLQKALSDWRETQSVYDSIDAS